MMSQEFLKYWFIGSSLVIAVLYLMFARRGQKLEEAKDDARRAVLIQQLQDIKSRTIKSQDDYAKNAKDYFDLRANHADLLLKLGIEAPDDDSGANN